MKKDTLTTLQRDELYKLLDQLEQHYTEHMSFFKKIENLYFEAHDTNIEKLKHYPKIQEILRDFLVLKRLIKILRKTYNHKDYERYDKEASRLMNLHAARACKLQENQKFIEEILKDIPKDENE